MDAQAPQAAQQEVAGSPQPATKGRRARVAFWTIFSVAGVVLLIVALNSREHVQTSENTAAFSLDFPDGYSRAKSIGKSLAIENSNKATVILNPNSNTPPLAVATARHRLHSLTCQAPTNVRQADGQTIITANATEPCGLFQSTATVLGAKHRVTVSCSAPKPPQAVAACRQTLDALRVK